MEQKHYGIYRAIVEDNRDPDNLRRLKVSIPQITGRGKDQKTGWIWPIISTKRPPAIGSGVWVFYLGGDPDYPVWIGEFGKNEQGLFCYGAFLSTADQTATINTAKAVTFNTTSISSGVKLSNTTKLVVEQDGTYNVQFSVQVYHGGGGGSGETIYVWFKKNGSNIANSATAIITKSGVYTVMTVNLFEKMKKNDYFEIYWKNDNASLRLEAVPASGSVPAVPSVIATVNQVA